MIFGKAAKEDLEIEQLDMVTAFLNPLIADGLLIYVEQPTGYETLENLVCLLLRTLYGLKQSPRLWYQTLHNFLISMGFCRTEADHSVFIRGKIIIAVYVDDLLLVGKNTDEINSIKRALKGQFKMTDLGPCQHYLGMGVTRDRDRGLIYLSLSTCITKVLRQFGLDGCHSVSTPMDRKEYLKLE